MSACYFNPYQNNSFKTNQYFASMPAFTLSEEEKKCSQPVIPYSLLADDSKTWREKVPVGIRFKPNDQVLAGYYLAKKVSGHIDCPIFKLIKEVDGHQCQPSLLSSLTYDFGDGRMYFFTHSFKRRNVYRHVPGGFWKKTGNLSYIKGKDRKKPLATKTKMVYYEKDQNSKAVRTPWLMKEYMLLESQLPKEIDKESKMLTPWTICVVYSWNQQGSRGEDKNKQKKHSLS